MQITLKLEEILMLLFGVFLFSRLDLSWWWFVGLFFVPDIGMLGYLVNKNIGAFLYNLFHHKGVALLLYMLGLWFKTDALQIAGIVLFAHSSFDRVLGYGLKYDKGFKFTHLGEIGK